jgi:two-component system response regulator YesN
MYKLLICDDERTIREGIARSVDWKTLNIDLTGTAKDGAEGWQWIQQNAPQFVITDIRMPKMDGIELLKTIIAHYPLTKVLLLSGYNDFSYAQQGLRYRAFDYLLKPTNPDAIRDSLENAIAVYESEVNPDRENGSAPESELEELHGQCWSVIRFMEENYRDDLSLEKTAAQFYLSPGHLNRVLKKETGYTFLSYLTKVRIERAKQLLATRRYNVYEVGEMTGYHDSKYFSQLFRKFEGMTPSGYMQMFKK